MASLYEQLKAMTPEARNAAWEKLSEPERQSVLQAREAAKGGAGAPAPAPATTPASASPVAAGGPPQPQGEEEGFDMRRFLLDPDYFAARHPKIASFLHGVGQGISMGGGDEADAFLRSTFGGPDYSTALEEERGRDKAAQEAHPWAYGGGELAGAIAPAVIPGVGTAMSGGRAATVTGQIGRGVLSGTALGTVEGFNRGEGKDGTWSGDIRSRAANAVPYALFGGGAGAAAPVLGAVTDALVGFANKKMGRTVGTAVRTEMSRLAERSGLSVDEIVQRVANGETFPEMNASALAAVKAFARSGGPAANVIKTAATKRAAGQASLAREAVEGALRGPQADVPGSLMQAWKAGDDAIKAELGGRYSSIYASAPEVPPQLARQLEETLGGVPGLGDDIEKTLRATPGAQPLYDSSTGKLVRTPRLEELERARSALRDKVDAAYRAGDNTLAQGLEAREKLLREGIDQFSPSLAGLRSEYATQSGANRAFKLGQGGPRAAPEVFDQGFRELGKGLPADAVGGQQQAAREGFAQSLRDQMTTPRATTSLLDQMADPGQRAGMNLRTALPEGAIDTVEPALEAAQRAKVVKNELVTGRSDTGEILAEMGAVGPNSAEKVGDLIMQASMGTVAGGPAAGAGTVAARGLVQGAEALRKLSAAQRTEVAQIIMSTNPELIERALAGDARGLVEQAAMLATRVAAPVGLVDMMGAD